MPAPPRRRWPGYSLRSLLCVVAALAIWIGLAVHRARQHPDVGFVPDFGRQEEWTELDYDEFQKRGGDRWFDPVGASNIFYRLDAGRDGYDAWWRMSISRQHFQKLLAAIAPVKNGPNPISENASTSPPTNWKPSSSTPSWWNPPVRKASHFHWCFAAGGAERHHGWYFAYDSNAQSMWCWHWNHQWSSDQCL
jgi:hypothetical protein